MRKIRPQPRLKTPKAFTETPPAKATVGLAVIFRDNLSTIQALLDSVAGHFDEYSFTDTGSSDGTRVKVESFLKNHAGAVTDFEWCDDFSKARQFNFERLSTRFRMFLDSDDVLQNGEKVRVLCDVLDKKHPHIMGSFLSYDYDVDESLGTMRLVKWDDKWQWLDAIHERLEWSGVPQGRREEVLAKTQEITVWHKRKTPEEKDQALRRNARIAEREYVTATDPKYRGRLARTIAMEMKLDNRPVDALPYLKEVYAAYPNFPEGRQAAADVMKCYLVTNDLDDALAWSKKAGPSYEALTHHARGEWQKCIDRQSCGFVIPQQTTHEGFLYERGAAVVASAEAALRLGYRPDAVERALNTVRADLREHPMHVAGTARIRSVINRITIVVPGTPQPFDTNSGGSMLGGSEEAVLYLSRALAKQGRNVRIYSPLPPTTVPGLDCHGVNWQDVSDFNHHDEHGTLVVWRSGMFALDLLKRTKVIQDRLTAGEKEGTVPHTGILASSFWLHDRAIGLPPDLGYAVCKAFDTVVVLSEHHRRMIIQDLGGRDPGNIVTLSNGIVAEQFAGLAENPHRDPNLCVYSSCASRGLRVLLEQWPKVKAAVPGAKLDLYYDWSMLRNAQPELYADVMTRYEAVRHLDVVHHGGVGHAELNTALSTANVLAYLHAENTEVETFCITGPRATAAGATVLTMPNGALPEVVPRAHFESDVAGYVRSLISLLEHGECQAERSCLAKETIDRFSWDSVATRFSAVWSFLAKSTPAGLAEALDGSETEVKVEASPNPSQEATA